MQNVLLYITAEAFVNEEVHTKETTRTCGEYTITCCELNDLSPLGPDNWEDGCPNPTLPALQWTGVIPYNFDWVAYPLVGNTAPTFFVKLPGMESRPANLSESSTIPTQPQIPCCLRSFDYLSHE